MELLGLVLEGGAMRAIYTAGVLDVFMEQNIWPDGLIGVSAGAIHGSVYLGNQPGRTIRYYKKYSRHKNFMSFYSLLTTGDLVGEQFCYHDLPDFLDPFDYDTFAQSKTAYYVTCTDLDSGKAVYRRCTDLHQEMEYMRASASMPYVSKIVEIEGQKLLDGGVADSIPLKAFQRMGYDKNIVVLTQCEGYRKKPQKPWLAKLFYRKYPRFIDTLLHRHTAYNQSVRDVEDAAAKGEVFLIRPSQDLKIDRMERDPARLEAQYNLGRADALAALPALKEWINR
ncbi:MAG: patatin family protein [Clostridia bacterium]|nr:patatin family protein [Clostridia bacterium]